MSDTAAARNAPSAEPPDTERRLAAARRVSRLCSALVAAVGVVVLLGWVLRSDGLKSLFVQPPVTVKANTAVSFLTAGLALLLLTSARLTRGRLAAVRAAAIFVLLLGGLTLSEHLVGWNLGIDELLFEEPPGALVTVSPNRMGPPASLSFMLIGLSLFLLPLPGDAARRSREVMALAVMLIGLLGVLGYASGVGTLYAVARVTGISLTTAVVLLLLGTGLLTVHPEHRLLALLCRGDEAGALVRELTVPALLLPLVAATVLTRGMKAGLYDGAFALAALALILVVSLTAVIWRSGTRLSYALEERDASERERRRREDELRAANRRQTEFLAVLSHELRNPLAPMRYAIERIEDPASTPSSPKSVLARQLAHMVRLVDDLLDITRITSGKIQLRKEAVALKDVIDQALEAAGPEIRAARHYVDVSVPVDAVWVEADRDRLTQVLTNLLANACRYTQSAGRIAVDLSTREADAVLSVRDTGIGLQQTDLERVFDMFTQVSGPGSGGLGVGLALAKGVVLLHGGSVEARSGGLGQGSEFVVRLPLATAPPVAAAVAKIAPASGRSRRVLLVDDNPDSADMMGTLLRLAGHDVRVAYDGASALREIVASPLEIGVFDIGLPDIDGYELARRVHAEGHAMYLIAVTGWGQEADRQRAHEAGFHAHLTKPANPDDIRRLVAEAPAPEGVGDDAKRSPSASRPPPRTTPPAPPPSAPARTGGDGTRG